MADNFRGSRGDAPGRSSVSDPLAELARLIGQSAPRPGQGGGHGPDAQRYDDAPPVSQVDWAAGDDAYAEPAHAAQDDYPSHSPHGAAWSHEAADRDRYDEPPPARHYAELDAAFEDGSDRSEPRSPAFGTEAPRYAPPAYDDEYESDDRPHYGAPAPYGREAAHDPDQDDYEQDAPAPRRSGTVLVLAVLGLTVLGSAGAFGYRAMFGRSVVAGMPPIIKPAEGPIKVQPKVEAHAGQPGQAEPASKTGERLVEHQEQPVDVQSANPPVPRVVQTIPVISNAPAAPIPGGQSGEFNAPGQMPLPPAQQGIALPPAAANPPAAAAPQQAQPLAPGGSGAKPVHTVVIRPGQQPGAGNPAPAAAPPAAHAARTHEPAQRPRQTATAGGPLSIVPGPEGEAQSRLPARSHVASRTPEATSSVGGYAVQVTSQRSEAEAEAAYRALQAKYPQELGSHRPLVRRADLGAKGTYYRAMVGPFASSEQAAELCSKLKAAGGSCIVQRN